jgi:hypothetical protein
MCSVIVSKRFEGFGAKARLIVDCFENAMVHHRQDGGAVSSGDFFIASIAF